MKKQSWNMRVQSYMDRYKMAEVGESVLAAVSGGADSVCLLLLLREIAQARGMRLAAFHLHHGIRGAEADRDEAFVRELCERLEVPLRVVREDVPAYARDHGLSEEEAGRELRYRYLQETAEEFGCTKIATAHHRDDQVETVLLNLFRGSGLRGLGGIRPVRGNVIRPLLCMTRAEIEAYLRECGCSWCEDSTNRENLYVRNKVRNELIPWLEREINGQVSEHMERTAAFAAEADAYFVAEADRLLREFGTLECPDQRCISVKVPAERFDEQADMIKTYLVRAMISRVAQSEKDITAGHIAAICGLTGPGGGKVVHLPYGLVAVRGYDTLEIRSSVDNCGGQSDPKPLVREITIGQSVDICGYTVKTNVFPREKAMEIPKKECTKWFDYDKIKGTLCVRTREPGDYIEITGGKRKLLKRFFIDEKIPEGRRVRLPLFADGSHILWIIGYRISEYYKVTEETQRILEVQIEKGDYHG